MKILKGVFVAVFMLVSASAFADRADQDSGVYMALDFGIAKGEFIGSSTVSNSASSPVLGIDLGYKVNQYLAVEGGNITWGKNTQTDGLGNRAEFTSSVPLFIAAVGRLPLGRHFAFTGNLGMAQTDTKVHVIGASTAHYKKTAPTYGVGMEVGFNKHFGMRLKYDHFDTDTGTITSNGFSGGKKSVNQFGLGFVITF